VAPPSTGDLLIALALGGGALAINRRLATSRAPAEPLEPETG
jgi:hypothetical protein